LLDAPVSAFQAIPVSQISSLKYTPTIGFAGVDVFGWNASDGTQFANGGALLILGVVTPVPVTFSKDAFENSTLNFTADDFGNSNHYSGGGPLQSIKVMSLPTHGTLNLTVNSVTNPVSLNQVINVGDLGGFSYTPTAGYGGADTFNWA